MRILKKTLYVCELCKRMYESKKLARTCEDFHGGIPVPPRDSSRGIFHKDGRIKAAILFVKGEMDEGL